MIFTSVINAQENKLLKELNHVERVDNQVSYIMKLPIKNLKNNSSILNLKKKLNSELNTIYSCVISFVNSKDLKLTDKEIDELKKRTEKISSEFYKAKKFVLLKTSGGIAPVYGVGMDTIAEKKVVIVHLGGDCSIDETDLKREEITSVFNKKMELLMNK